MTITTEEAETLAGSIRGASEMERAEAANALRTLAAERDAAIAERDRAMQACEQIAARAEAAEALLADSVDKAQAWDAVAKANNRTADRSAECADLRTRAEKAEAARDKAIHQLSEISRALGEAEGKLAASEMAGIVEGWKARARTAEAEAEKLREAIRRADQSITYACDTSISKKGFGIMPEKNVIYGAQILRAALNQGGDDDDQ